MISPYISSINFIHTLGQIAMRWHPLHRHIVPGDAAATEVALPRHRRSGCEAPGARS